MQFAPECALFVPYLSQIIGNEHARMQIKMTMILYKTKRVQTVVSQLAHSFNQRARDSSSLERTKIPRRIVRFLVGFFFYTPFARSLHGFCTVRIFRVRWSKSVNYSAIRAIFCNSGQQSQAELRFYRGVCVLQKFQQCRYGDGRFCFNRGSLHRCCSLYGFHITAGDHQLVSRAQAARWNR